MFLIHDNYVCIRKPSGLPTTRGKRVCLLSLWKAACDSPTSYPASFPPQYRHIRQRFVQSTEMLEIAYYRWEKNEFWLLNRLDVPTQGIVVVAKSMSAKQHYLSQQQQWKVYKTYVAHVYGRPRQSASCIAKNIYHHPACIDRMTCKPVAWQTPQRVCTQRVYAGAWWLFDTSLLRVYIRQGARHQIRCHLGSIGHPIVHDPLYTTSRQRAKRRKQGRYSENGVLGLSSVGVYIPS